MKQSHILKILYHPHSLDDNPYIMCCDDSCVFEHKDPQVGLLCGILAEILNQDLFRNSSVQE